MEIKKKFIKHNYTKGRKSPITRITLHTPVGNAKSLYEWFNRDSTNASTHYYVNKYGEIEQYVKESDQAWANSSRSANGHAVTIEVWDGGNPNDTKRTDKTYESTAWLVADIAKRYNIPLMVVGKSNARDWNKAGIDKHWYFANKSCPAGLDVQRVLREAKTILNENSGYKMTDKQYEWYKENRPDVGEVYGFTKDGYEKWASKHLINDYMNHRNDWSSKFQEQMEAYDKLEQESNESMELLSQELSKITEELENVSLDITEYTTTINELERKLEACEALKKGISGKWENCKKKLEKCEASQSSQKPEFDLIDWIVKLFTKK